MDKNSIFYSILTLIPTASKPKSNSLLCAEKSHYYSSPCTALRGEEGVFYAALKI
jgi:hypothetical protein